MPRRPSSARWLPVLLVGALAGAVAAQAPTAPTAITTFQSPDGSRFVLVADPSMGPVHWAVATPADPADEPPGLEGLAATVANASLGGTWRTGSVDPARERLALDALDQAWQDMLAAPQDPAAAKRVAECEAAAAALGDPLVYHRVLATLPAHRPEVVAKEGVSVLHLTTVAAAIGPVAEALLERREEQALRELGKTWMRDVVTRQNLYDLDPAATVHAELLALAMPNHPASRAAERAGRSMPRRAQALAVWQATQRPERTVHVLVGGFDPEAARKTLCDVFRATALPAATAARPQPLRPIQSVRRSTVPGVREPMVALAWVLPEAVDPYLLDAAARWFADGPDSWIGRELAKAGRKTASVRCRAPWPVVVGGQSLLLVDVADPAGTQGIADLVVQKGRLGAQKPPGGAELQPVATAQQLAWNIAASDPRWLAAELARAAVLQPQVPPRLGPPDPLDGRAIQQLLARILAGQPVVVEGRR